MNGNSIKKIGIVSSCQEDWGGSEELWAKAVEYLLKDGASVSFMKTTINKNVKAVKQLCSYGMVLKPLTHNFKDRIGYYLYRKRRKRDRNGALNNPLGAGIEIYKFRRFLQTERFDIVVITQGMSFDGLQYAYECKVLNIPYITISQKVVEFYWLPSNKRPVMREVYKGAIANVFVCKQNQAITEEQFGFRFKNALVIPNPVKFSPEILPYPINTEEVRLACIGRLFVIDKGQDLLIRVLSRPKWKSRSISISFVGVGDDEAALKDLALMLEVTNIRFLGYSDNIEDLWLNHHALILPSRSEGLPLVLLETMALGRIAIATNVGGNPELIVHGVNGFLAEANESSLDEILELAWNHKTRWPEMAKSAYKTIIDNIDLSPEIKLSTLILNPVL